MMGRITEILICSAKGQPTASVPQVLAVKEMGLQGDRFCDGSDRQISMMSEDLRRWMAEQEVQGLCFRRYKGNLMLEGAEPSSWKKGTELQVGAARLRVTITDKECFPECERHRQGLTCRLRGGCCYARVVEEGLVAVGDSVGEPVS